MENDQWLSLSGEMSEGSIFHVPSGAGARRAENFRTLWRGFQKLPVVPTLSLPNISVMGFYFLSAINTCPIFSPGSKRTSPEVPRGSQRVPEGFRGFKEPYMELKRIQGALLTPEIRPWSLFKVYRHPIPEFFFCVCVFCSICVIVI